MKKFEDIQKKSGLNDRQMGIQVLNSDAMAWKALKNTKGQFLRNIIKLWKFSGESAQSFLSSIETELIEIGSLEKEELMRISQKSLKK